MYCLTNTRRLLAVALSVTLSAVPAFAQHVTIDFHEFRSDTAAEYQAVPGGQVYGSNGLGFYAAFGSSPRDVLGTWGTNDSSRPDLMANVPRNLGSTAAALFGTQFGEQINSFFDDGRVFNLYHIDLAHEFAKSYLLSGNLSPISLTFYGYLDNTNVAQQTFTIPVPSADGSDVTPELNTYTFNSTFLGINEFAMLQGNGSAVSWQFTNVDVFSEPLDIDPTPDPVDATPEPASLILLATGLCGIGAVARRRRV